MDTHQSPAGRTARAKLFKPFQFYGAKLTII